MDSTSNYKTELSTPVQFIKGVGPNKAQAFETLGVSTLADLLEHFPRNWQFMPEPQKIKTVKQNRTATILATIEQTDYQQFRRTPLFEAIVADDSAACRIVWFHSRYLQKQLEPGQIILAWGKFTRYKHQLQLTNPKFTIIDRPEDFDPDSLSGPLYPACAKLSSRQIQKIIHPLLDNLDSLLPEFYPPKFQKQNNLIPRPQAFRQIHNPLDEKQLAQAKRRLKYDELFLMQLGLALKRYKAQNFSPATPMKLTEIIDSKIRKRFPFLLTDDQNKVIEEITVDMAKTTPANRLIQGDVGSGKTVVALYAALLAVANKTQVAIMAPTEILANQHMISIERYLKNTKVTRTLITGAQPPKKRTEIAKDIACGKIDIVVGTVALISQDIDFANLGLVVIDEQHKFGVHQRASLRKEKSPHCLVMTATPIPRTLAMTAFGDLDISTIKHCPPGRGQVITKSLQPYDKPAAFEFIRQRLRAKKQAYFVYPRIETDDSENLKAATQEYKYLKEKIFPEFQVELLHGKIKSEQKNQIMNRFRKGQIDVLVSTIVIEVGLDVPNATIMVIEGADNFGLAQLHQLRGRIGRGQSRSYCLLLSDSENPAAQSRLEIMTRTNDGFKIAEHDLKLRGPGELFSTRQHGLPDLKIANIIEDFDLLNLARKNAFDLVKNDPYLSKSEHKNIRKAIIQKFGQNIALADIA